jgi:hypothetical protein
MISNRDASGAIGWQAGVCDGVNRCKAMDQYQISPQYFESATSHSTLKNLSFLGQSQENKYSTLRKM